MPENQTNQFSKNYDNKMKIYFFVALPYTFSHLKRPFYRAKKNKKRCKIHRNYHILGLQVNPKI